MPLLPPVCKVPFTFESFLFLSGRVAGFKDQIVYLHLLFLLQILRQPNRNPTGTLWKAVTLRQEGPFDNERSQPYKRPNKTTERAPASRCNASSKTLVYLRLPATSRKMLTLSIMVATLLESSWNPSGPVQT